MPHIHPLCGGFSGLVSQLIADFGHKAVRRAADDLGEEDLSSLKALTGDTITHDKGLSTNYLETRRPSTCAERWYAYRCAQT